MCVCFLVRRAVQQMCVAADLPGRMLQVLGLSPDKYLPSPHEPWDAPKGSSCGEVYLQFLGAACTYVSYSSGICECSFCKRTHQTDYARRA